MQDISFQRFKQHIFVRVL